MRGQITPRDLLQVWRILVAVVICQLVGGAISSVIAFHHFWFLNLWIGAAIGALPGVVIGAVWHFSGPEERRESARIAFFLSLIAVFVITMALAVVLPHMRGEMRRLSGMSQLRDEAIDHIEVVDPSGGETVLTLSDPAVTAAFAEACSSAVGHSPNHPRYSHTWYVVVSGDTGHEFLLHLNPQFPESVIGSFVTKSGNSMSRHGCFESRALRPWVEEHLLNADADG